MRTGSDRWRTRDRYRSKHHVQTAYCISRLLRLPPCEETAWQTNLPVPPSINLPVLLPWSLFPEKGTEVGREKSGGTNPHEQGCPACYDSCAQRITDYITYQNGAKYSDAYAHRRVSILSMSQFRNMSAPKEAPIVWNWALSVDILADKIQSMKTALNHSGIAWLINRGIILSISLMLPMQPRLLFSGKRGSIMPRHDKWLRRSRSEKHNRSERPGSIAWCFPPS